MDKWLKIIDVVYRGDTIIADRDLNPCRELIFMDLERSASEDPFPDNNLIQNAKTQVSKAAYLGFFS